jgi:DNA topoisomerase-3
MKTLIIAEKPSVAADLAKALSHELGKFEKKGKSRDSQYFDNDRAAITSAVGHLVELKMPAGPNGKNLPWKFDVLPAIPERFELQPVEDTQARFNHIRKLVKSKDVGLIVNACDAGREGELIFQYIMDLCGVDKPVKRLWMQSMTTAAIKDAWKHLSDGEDMSHLADAARCRSESDWLVGLNATRAMTCFRSRHGGFNITPAGRVQTPTLAILAKREREIAAFTPEAYSEVHADFGVQAGQYAGLWVDLDWKKNEEQPHGKAERIWDPARAEQIRARCEGRDGSVTEEKKPQKQIAPQLYDLTTLQREAPFTAKQTLSIAQALYERHKMVTYPRTASRYLPEDYVSTVIETTQELAKSGLPLAKWAADSLANNRITLQKRIFDNAKISDHFAIIPTGRVVKLRDSEQKLYDMIAKRFIAAFFPHAEFEVTKRLTTIDHAEEQDTFRTNGKILVIPGWRAVYEREAGAPAGKDELVPVAEGESAHVDHIEAQGKETKPPARFTESTLLAAMEGAGKLIDDEELREAMAESGLGTPATRASTIEGLLGQKYIARDGRDLNVTGRGMRLIHLLEEMKIDALRSPSLTGEWEAKLNQMERGQLDRKSFMNEITAYTTEIVNKARGYYKEKVDAVFPDLACVCPNCGAEKLKQTDATYDCYEEDCDFKISKWIAGRELTPDEAKTLFNDKFLPEMTGFVSRFNKPFDAALELIQPVTKTGKKQKWKTNFVFDQDEPNSMDELSEDQVIQTLTLKTGAEAKIYATDKAYYVPELKTQAKPDGFQLGKTILKKELQSDEITKLFTEGKTELLKGFISKRTRRPFSAFLTLDFETGKIGFEFAPRPAKKKAAAKKA